MSSVKSLPRPPLRIAAGGFTLVEMMIALVLGLLVVGAVIALVVSMMKANQQTIQATRLTQELRATTAVIAADVKRARGVEDPMWWGKKGATPWQNITVFSNTCVGFGYEGAAGGGFHVVRVNGGKVEMGSVGTSPTSCAADNWERLSSDFINIVANPGATPAPAFQLAGREFRVTLTAALVSDNSDIAAIRRTLTQTVFVRSLAGS